MIIDGYFIGGYWWLLIGIILMTIGGYSISGYWWLLIGIILMIIPCEATFVPLLPVI